MSFFRYFEKISCFFVCVFFLYGLHVLRLAVKGVSHFTVLCSLQLGPGSSVRVKITLIMIRLLAWLVMVLIEQISTTNV